MNVLLILYAFPVFYFFFKKWTGLVSKMFIRMLQMHNGSPGVWIAASKWEFEGNNSPDTARSLMQRALRFLPKSELLWLEVSIYVSSC